MIEHPGTELQLLIKEKGLTQKEFSSILGKKVSELNELLKGKRNITIQRDYLLHQTLGTPMKYWILKQIDYDYSLLDIEEISNSPLLIGEGQGEVSQHHDVILSDSEESFSPLGDGKSHKSSLLREDLDGAEGLGEIGSQRDSSSSLHSSSEGHTNTQETPNQEPDSKDNEDLKNRADIFRSF